MAGGKASPRQKMINMMYLVLTAMLALNVSAEILKAFYLVELSMNKAGTNIDVKNTDIMNQFAKQMKNQAEKTKPFYDQAKKAQAITEEFVKYVEDMKTYIVTNNGKRSPEEARQADGQLKMRDNIEIHAHYMTSKSGPKKGAELKAKVNKVREDLLNVLRELKLNAAADRIGAQTGLVAEDEGKHSWESELFEHTPQAAVVTLLTKIQNDAKSTNADVIAELFSGITASDATFDKLQAKIIPTATSVAVGEKYEAEVILTAYDSKQANKVIINGQEYMPEEGVVKYTAPASGVGNKKVSGKIIVASKEGEKEYPFETDYSVYVGAASVAANAMNVLYIGLANPITVAVPGYTPEQVRATISTGSLNPKGKGQYEAIVSQRGDAKINVSVMVDGKAKSMGAFPFRIRPIPTPEAKLGTLGSGGHTGGSITAQPGVYGMLGDGFAYEGVKYVVNGYNFTYVPKKGDAVSFPATGTPLPAQAKGVMNRLKKGDKIIVSDIVATGPGGRKNLNPIVIDVR